MVAYLLYGANPDRVRQGMGLPALLQMLRIYGYHDRWSRKGIEELVQGRLLEVLEAPAAAEFTKAYRLHDSHSFRPSPLAVAVFERIQLERSYLALLGNDLAFQSRTQYGRYLATLKLVVDTIGSTELDLAALDLLLESDATEITRSYLSDRYGREQPLVDLSKCAPEVAGIETRLEATLAKVGVSKTIITPDAQPHRSRGNEQQLTLIEGASPTATAETIRRPVVIPIPPGTKSTMVASSRIAAPVFWALVNFRANGRPWVQGAEIARLMNEHVFSDQERKEMTNVSRALRSAALRSQRWLAVDGEKGAWTYGLASCWRKEWRRVFQDEPPDLGDA